MFYPGIDQHARQITISLPDESGDVLQARQVSTRPERIQAFFAGASLLFVLILSPPKRIAHE